MKLGVRAHDYGRSSAAELAEILQGEGFEAIQLAVPKAIDGIGSYGDLTAWDAERIKNHFRERQIEISVLGCYIDISSTNEIDRNIQLEQFGHALSWCNKLGAKMVGTESSYGILDMEQKEKTWQLVEDGVKRMIEQAEKYETNVGIEPVAAHTLYSPEWTRRLLDRVGSSRLQIIFDPVNLLIPDNIQRQNELWETCFALFGKEIGAIHLKDFVMGDDGQFKPCLLGKGLMKYDGIFTWLHREKPDISILREEMDPVAAHRDIEFMKALITK